MFLLAFVASFLAAISLASRLGCQTSLFPGSVPDADNLLLLAVFESDNNIREPLVLGSDVSPSYSSLAWLEV